MIPDAHLVKKIARTVGQVQPVPHVVGVAVSGGADSSMLAIHALQWAQKAGVELHLFHINHGLQAAADEWQHQVHDLAHQLQVPCHSCRITMPNNSGVGIEAAARRERYRALTELADKANVSCLLLGHHQGDQAETVLLRLLRGAGPHGLAAMSAVSSWDSLCLVRPWLDVPQATLLELAREFAQKTGWHAVYDPSNDEDRYTRNAVRVRLVPELNTRWPAWKASLARHARQSAQTREILQEVARSELNQLEPDYAFSSFSLELWRTLSLPRQALVLRYWIGMHGLSMPTEARLNEIMKQLRTLHALGHDRSMRVRHAGAEIRCDRGRVTLKGVGKKGL